jgi:hypothetical protein
MNFGELCTEVADWLNRDDLSTQIPTFINHAQLSLERKFNFQYMEMLEEYTGVATYSLAAPMDYKSIKGAFVTDVNGDRRLLTKCDLKVALLKYPNYTTNTGTPQFISTLDARREFIIRPTPTSPVDIDIFYYAKSTPLVNTTDTNWLTENAPDILLYGALLDASPFLADVSLINIWQSRFDIEVSNLGLMDIREVHQGSYQTVSPSGDVV